MDSPVVDKKKYSKCDLVVAALYSLGGASRYIHMEDVALKSAELSPKSFSWKKYPEHPNLESVRLALKNESESKQARVFGSIRDGWMLTSKGLAWCLADPSISINKFPLDQIQKEIVRIKNTHAFIKIAAKNWKELSNIELQSLLRIDDYFSPRNRKERVMALANATVIDDQLSHVIVILKQRGFIDSEVE